MGERRRSGGSRGRGARRRRSRRRRSARASRGRPGGSVRSGPAQRVGDAVGERRVVGRAGAPVRERARRARRASCAAARGRRRRARRRTRRPPAAWSRAPGGRRARRRRRTARRAPGRKAARYTRTSSTAPRVPAHYPRLRSAMADRAPRILLVDDEQPIQTLLSFPLQRDGYEVVQASDGREALARFSEQQFDLVVLDLMLPRMDGLEVCKRLRGQGLDRADHHAHGQVGGDRQGARARARRRRLHHQAVLDARVPLAREGRAAARRHGPARRPTTSSRSRSAACASTRRSAR